MEMDVNGIIDKIKKEGLQKADKDAGEILTRAKSEAERILQEASAKKEEIINEGRAQAEAFKKTAEEALHQGARDVLITLKESVEDVFLKIIRLKISESLSGPALKDLIVKTITSFAGGKSQDIEVILNKEDLKALEKPLFEALSEEIKKHVTLGEDGRIKKGFRMGVKGTYSYLDFTDEAVTRTLRDHLNPRLAYLIDINREEEKK